MWSVFLHFERRLQSDCIHEQAAEADFECMLYRKQTTENLSVSDVSCILNTEALVQQIVTAKLQGTDSGALAYLFHRTLAEQIVAACKAAREYSGRNKTALSGGVFPEPITFASDRRRSGGRKDLTCCGII